MRNKEALIRRWNKYHPINCEVARHIRAWERQGEEIREIWDWEPMVMLDVLALCLWAVKDPDIETTWWADDGAGGGTWFQIDSDYILGMNSGWHPKTVMDFFKYEWGDDDLTDSPTDILDRLKEAPDPLNATHILIDVLSDNLSSFLYSHFIADNDEDSF